MKKEGFRQDAVRDSAIAPPAIHHIASIIETRAIKPICSSCQPSFSSIARIENPSPNPFINLKNQMKMKRETLKKILNFVITVLTAVASAFCVQSCQ